MKTNRRNFIKAAGVAGTGLVATSVASCASEAKAENSKLVPHELVKSDYQQKFNMSGYAAPALDVVRVGYIGIGARGLGSVRRMRLIEGVEIRALCDIFGEKVNNGQKALAEMGLPAANAYTGNAEIWKEMCQDSDLDLIYVATPRYLHPEMCIFAMESGKHVATEIPAAFTIEQAWKLVKTSETTKKHCCILENITYDFWKLLVLNMVRQGFLGEVVHVDAGYLHDQREINIQKSKSWRIEEFINKKGNIYPTHGLGPACQVLNANRGDRLDYIVSMSSDDFTMGPKIAELAKSDDFYQKYVNKWKLGNINTSTIKTKNGKTIMLQYNVSNPRPHEIPQQVVGTDAITNYSPGPPRIARGREWLNQYEVDLIAKKFTPPLVSLIGEMAKKIGGHGGCDFLMEWRLIDCFRNGLPIDQDVYDAALWSSVVPLSAWSVANYSAPIKFPDFTCGSWKTNEPVDIEMKRGGGNTIIRSLP